MKKVSVIFAAVLCLIAFMSVRPVAAQYTGPFDTVCTSSDPYATAPVPDSGADASTVCAEKDKPGNPIFGKDGIILRAARFVTFITGIACIIILIYSGLKYVTTNGDSNSINSAKNTILYALIGLVISLLAQGIILFVINSVK